MILLQLAFTLQLLKNTFSLLDPGHLTTGSGSIFLFFEISRNNFPRVTQKGTGIWMNTLQLYQNAVCSHVFNLIASKQAESTEEAEQSQISSTIKPEYKTPSLHCDVKSTASKAHSATKTLGTSFLSLQKKHQG